MDGNLCRCMTYSRIQKAIMRAAAEMRTASNAGTERRPHEYAREITEA